ncbi:MAG: GNAT family N-acetyltransferase [Candidatus Hodarchaeota archaeon]
MDFLVPFRCIQSLAVDPRFQRRRVRYRLVKVLEKHAREFKCNKLFVQTAWAMFEAIKLYWRLGFSLEGYHSRQFLGEDLFSFGKIL